MPSASRDSYTGFPVNSGGLLRTNVKKRCYGWPKSTSPTEICVLRAGPVRTRWTQEKSSDWREEIIKQLSFAHVHTLHFFFFRDRTCIVVCPESGTDARRREREKGTHFMSTLLS